MASFTTITFADIPSEIVTDQYAEQGLLFTDGNDFSLPAPDLYPLDGSGLNGGFGGEITIQFDEPQLALGVHYPGSLDIQLFAGTTPISDLILFGGSPPINNFGGLISTVFFDRAVISDGDGNVSIDNLYFGIPTPGVLSLTALIGRRRR